MAAIQRADGRRRRASADINVVPYIDVMLVLLVIFMVAAPLVNPGVVNLPSVGGAVAPKGPPIIVTISVDESLTAKRGNTSVQIGKNADRDALIKFVQQQQIENPELPVVIAADQSVKYEAVMSVMSALKDNGVARVGLMVKSK